MERRTFIFLITSTGLFARQHADTRPAARGSRLAKGMAAYTARRLVVIAPELGRSYSQFTFGDRARLQAAGEKAALEVIDRLRPLFAPAR